MQRTASFLSAPMMSLRIAAISLALASFGLADVAAFAPSHVSITTTATVAPCPRPSSKLNNFLDAVGDLLGGPKLEAETNLPYDPPFSSELSISDSVRTFAIKERP